MILRRRVALGGVWLDEIDERILTQGIDEGAPRMAISAVSPAGRDGQRVTRNRRDCLDIKVRFTLMIRKGDMQEREELIEKIRGWAAEGGILTVNYRPDRMIRVKCADMPEVGDPWEWTREYTITFRAYGVPYWQTESAISAGTGIAQSAGCALQVPGTGKTQADVTISNESGATIQTVSISAGGCAMQFTSLGLGGSESLIINHDEDGYLRIRIRSGSGSYRSAMANRSEGSSDDLILSPGIITAAFSAQRACRMTISCRGRFV